MTEHELGGIVRVKPYLKLQCIGSCEELWSTTFWRDMEHKRRKKKINCNEKIDIS